MYVLSSALKVSVFVVILVRIFTYSDWIQKIRISTYLVWMQENADQNNSEYEHFLRSDLQRVDQNW